MSGAEAEHVAVCTCEWAASTRGGVDRQALESVAEAHAGHCGPVELRRIDEPAPRGELATQDGDIVSTFGGEGQ